MRLFVAADITDNGRNALEQRIKKVQLDFPFVKWVKMENLHITLKFIGEFPENRINDLKGALSDAALISNPFEAELEEFGCFPSKKRARVLWFGLKKGYNEFLKLADIIEKSLLKLGISAEDRQFHPHVTIGRAKRGHTIDFSNYKVENINFSFPVRYIGLYKSKLMPYGPVYTKMENFKIGNK